MFESQTISASILANINSPLAEIAIRSTVVLGLAAIGCRLLHSQSAAMRHRVWVLGLAASLVLPFASLVAPFSIPILPSSQSDADAATANASAIAAATLESDSTAAVGNRRGKSFVPQPEEDEKSGAAILPEAPPTVQPSVLPQPEHTRFPGIKQLLLFVWLTGTLTGSVLFLLGIISQSIRLKRLVEIEDEDWQTSVADAAKALRIKRSILTLESDEKCVPAVVGIFSPRLIVPCDWRKWSPAQRDCILLHELSHIKRRDVMAQMIGRCALVTYWFNPLVWFAVRQLRIERELAADDCVLRSGQTASDYAQQLLQTLRSCHPIRAIRGVAMGHSARLDQRVLAILDPRRRREPVSLRFAIVLFCVFGVLCGLLGGVTLSTQTAMADPPSKSESDLPVKEAAPAKSPQPFWKENYSIEYPGALPVSVAFSNDGKILLTGDTNGEVMALVFNRDDARWRWKSQVGGSHAAAAFSADHKKIYVTTKDGVRILDSRGKKEHLIEEKDSNPTAIGVFPDKTIAENFTRRQIVFGTPAGYFVKSWAAGKLPDTVGTIQTSTTKEGDKPANPASVPLAVDPKGRSAIMTGPIDGTGKVTGKKGKNVLWAYVCGDYEKGSPGNRVMVGHTATVVSAAWAKEGGTAVTGDTEGRVIVWNAKTMKEARRLELGGRVAALAISDDGKRTAAYVLGKRGSVFVWATANPQDGMKPIHTDLADFSGKEVYASLAFTPDGSQLAGCAMDRQWLARTGELIGKVRVWELSAKPFSGANSMARKKTTAKQAAAKSAKRKPGKTRAAALKRLSGGNP